jgi:FtsP/CotA-like multicopper oxidase with cupredoxin domain
MRRVCIHVLNSSSSSHMPAAPSAAPIQVCCLLPFLIPLAAGPALYAEAGDTLEVTLRNRMAFPVNLEPSGLMFPTPVVLNPNETFTYR